jgi:hypothetical protein
MNLLEDLHRAVSLKRGSGTVTEMQYAAYLTQRLPMSMIDEAGNLYVDLRTEPHHRTCFTAHIDTVHHKAGSNVYTIEDQFWKASGDALGADDGAGIALLMYLIDHRVPALYVFFRGEECGGTGSSWAADNMAELFSTVDRAIAFDRAGYHDVITKQSGGRCCSDEFATVLSEALTNEEFTLAFTACDTGVFTDTANLVDIVPECTNVSCGYFSQHGDREKQDVEFLQILASRIVEIDWDSLPVKRKAAPKKPKAWAQDWECWGADDSDAPRPGDDTEDIYKALCLAEQGVYTPLRSLLSDHLGAEYAPYVNKLNFSTIAIDNAFEAVLDGEDEGYVYSLLYGGHMI